MKRMKYYLTKKLSMGFEEAIEKVTEELKKEGFGVITTINVKNTIKEKLDIDFRPYIILGACNPHYAHQAISYDDKVGTLLPCNFVVQEAEKGVEVSAMNPHETMRHILEGEVVEMSRTITEKIQNVLDKLVD